MKLLVLVYLIATFSLLTFIVLFGHVPALRYTPIGLVNRLIRTTIPRLLHDLDYVITGGYFTRKGRRWYIYLFDEANPVVMIFYLFLLSGGITIFLTRVATDLDSWHQIVIPFMIFGPYYTLFKASFTDPGLITSRNHKIELSRYKFDNILFRSGVECRTCLREKPFVLRILG